MEMFSPTLLSRGAVLLCHSRGVTLFTLVDTTVSKMRLQPREMKWFTQDHMLGKPSI